MNRCIDSPQYDNSKELSLNEESKDVDFVEIIGKQFKYRADRLVLSQSSPYFQTILQDKTIREIILDNLIEAEAYMLISYIYYGEIKTESWREISNVMHAAFEFEMTELVDKCAIFLGRILTLQNVCYIYSKASICSLSHLENKCLSFILDAGFIILRSFSFQTLSQCCIIKIISNFYLNIDTEYSIFEVVLKWARSECTRLGANISENNIRKLIGPFLKYICIDDMSDAEKSAFTPLILDKLKNNKHRRVIFTTPLSLRAHFLSFKLKIDYQHLEFIGTNLNCIRFQVTRPIYLFGIQFQCIGKPALILNLKVVKENFPSAALSENSVGIEDIEYRGRNSRKRWLDLDILFDTPVRLENSILYSIYVTDPGMRLQVPQTEFFSSEMYTPTGPMSFELHSNEIWGITELLFL